MHPAEHDHVRVRVFLRVVAQPEGVADVIGHVLDFADLIVVREDHGVALALEPEDVLGQVGARAQGGASRVVNAAIRQPMNLSREPDARSACEIALAAGPEPAKLGLALYETGLYRRRQNGRRHRAGVVGTPASALPGDLLGSARSLRPRGTGSPPKPGAGTHRRQRRRVRGPRRAVLLCVKPYAAREVLRADGSRKLRRTVVARRFRGAGVKLADLQAAAGLGTPLVRAMPNTPCLVRKGVNGLRAWARAATDAARRPGRAHLLRRWATCTPSRKRSSTPSTA